jgi:hypothetical protein
MRRGLAIVVAMLLSWTLVLPAFSLPVENNLPACCRRAGKHHCMMRGAQTQSGQSFATVGVKCPYSSHLTMNSHHEGYTQPVTGSFYAELVHHPAQSPQTEASYRVSFDRSRQKRGPPVTPLS